MRGGEMSRSEEIENDGPLTGTMRAARLHAPEGPEALSLDEVERPGLVEGEALVRVCAAGITRDELTWPVDRLPAIPSYELSGVVALSVAQRAPTAWRSARRSTR